MASPTLQKSPVLPEPTTGGSLPAKRAMREGEEEAIRAALQVWRETGVWDATGLPEQAPQTEEEVQETCAYLKKLLGEPRLVLPAETVQRLVEVALECGFRERLVEFCRKAFEDGQYKEGSWAFQQLSESAKAMGIQLDIPSGVAGSGAEEGEHKGLVCRGDGGGIHSGGDEVFGKKGLVGHEAGTLPEAARDGQPE